MLNLILIDDDLDEAYIVRQALKQVDEQRVLTHFDNAHDFVTEMERLSKSNNLVLLDLNMPHLGGIEVLKKIKQNKFAANLPIVVYSNSNSPHDIELSYQYGANSYVRKPQGLGETIEFLRSLLNYWQKVNKT